MRDADAKAGDFTAFSHPVLATSCPDCKARIGVMCVRLSGHGAADFHKARKIAADDAFIARHGADAWIERTETGWIVHEEGRADTSAAKARGEDLPLFARVHDRAPSA
jgi:hypothetical protein